MKKQVDRAASAPSIERGHLEFEAPALAGYRWPYIEITGAEPGPSLCITGGVHVNELCSMQAAMVLAQSFAPEDLRGVVSIIPIVNLPALYDHHKDPCPVDGKSIHWAYPGDASGTFCEALAQAILFDWAGDAEALIDLHGGDSHEKFCRYTVWQQSGEAALDARNEALARCFDADFIVGLDPSYMDDRGRCCTAATKLGRLSLVIEGGTEARFEESEMLFHVNGVINAAGMLGMVGGRPMPMRRRQLAIGEYVFLQAPADGLITPRIEPCEFVQKGQLLMECRDLLGRPIGEVTAPETGYVIWRTSHLAAREGAWIGAVGKLA